MKKILHNFYILFIYVIGSTLGSLQKVKEMLRRLRWHRHQSGGLHHKSRNTMTSDLCSFIRGDKPDSNTSKGHPVKELSFETMATAMKEQQSRATVGLNLFILIDYPIHIETISRD